MNTLPISILALLLAVSGALAAPSPKETAFFETNIRPLLAEHCYKCHSAKATKVKGGLLLDSQAGWMNGGDSGEAIEPGNAKDSLLMKAVNYGDPDTSMPPKYKLSDKEIQALHDWIEMGAPDPRTEPSEASAKAASEEEFDIESRKNFWAFQPVKNIPPAKTADTIWAETDIDRYVLAGLEAKGLKPVADTDRRTLLRRVRYDLTGLPPSPEEIAAFERDSGSDREALAKVVDRLLRTPQFGERWGRHWLDIARYAESMGRTRNYPFPFAWRYRDYVIDAFNNDKPYDQFIREQIAGDLMGGKTDAEKNEHLIATGFLALGSMDLNENNAAQYKMDQIDEQIDTSGRAIMALTTGCARCHNHKFDPISQKDYYALAGIFQSTQTLTGYAGKKGGNKNYANGELLATLHGAGGLTPAKISEPDTGVDLAKRKKTLQTAIQLYNKGLKAKANASPIVQKLMERPKVELVKLLSEINGKDKKKQKKKGKGGGTKLDGPLVMAVRDSSSPKNSRVHLRGDIDTLGDEVPRGFLEVMSRPGTPSISEKSSGRLEYAQWLTAADNPLTARVMVNRIWGHLFGNGIVRTVDNFGKMGELPSHPELLDHLASNFVTKEWSMKAMIREMVLSRTYRLSSANDPQAFGIDPENRLLWHMNMRRLEVEAMRDTMLAVSGEIDLNRPERSVINEAGGGEIRKETRVIEDAVERKFRSVYLPIVRSFVPQMLMAFDFAEPSQVTGQRDVTTVSTQALFMMNNDFVLAQSDAAAKWTLTMNMPSDLERIAFAYEQSLARQPSSLELEEAEKFVADFSRSGDRQQAWSALYQSIFAGAEFRYIR
jgi:cytochrome c553